MTQGQITSANDAYRFMLAGNSRTTLVSLKTSSRYTYRVKRCDSNPNLYFVSLLAGPDNESDFVYLGVIRAAGNGALFATTAKTRNPDSVPVKAFKWAFQALERGVMPATLEIWHEGRCGRCARPLTVPDSIRTGFGPECAGKLAMAQ